jgi:hypothetical protein
MFNWNTGIYVTLVGIDYQPNGNLAVKNKDVTNKPSGLWYKYVLFSTILGMIGWDDSFFSDELTPWKWFWGVLERIYIVTWIIFGLFGLCLDYFWMWLGWLGLLGSWKKKATSQICNVNWEHETETLPDFIRRDSHGLTIVMTFEWTKN